MQRAPRWVRTRRCWRVALATAHPAGTLPDGREDWRAFGMRLVVVDEWVVTVMPAGWPADGKRWAEAEGG